MTSAGAAALGGASRPTTAAGATFELSRLQNEIRERDRKLDATQKESTALKSQVAAKERVLQAHAQEIARLKERALKSEGDAAAAAKEVVGLKGDKRKAETTNGELQRQVALLKEKVGALSARGPGFSEQVARLESEIKLVKRDNARLADEAKAVANQLRGKDRELTVAQGKLAWAAQVEGRNKELENEVLAQRRAAEQAAAECRMVQTEVRRKESDVTVLTNVLEQRSKELDRARADAAAAAAGAKAAEARAAELCGELAVTREELARASAVAGRVAASERKAGIKAEGTVAVAQHIEEVKYLQGEIGRLKDKLALAERDLAVAHSIKERYRSALEAANLPAALDVEKASAAKAPRASLARRVSGAAMDITPMAEEDRRKAEKAADAAAPAEVAALPKDPSAALCALSLDEGAKGGKGAAAKRRAGKRGGAAAAVAAPGEGAADGEGPAVEDGAEGAEAEGSAARRGGGRRGNAAEGAQEEGGAAAEGDACEGPEDAEGGADAGRTRRGRGAKEALAAAAAAVKEAANGVARRSRRLRKDQEEVEAA